jgi:Xaa-Pro aminopeptidase
VDRAARGTLERLGFGEMFGHGTGHGLGIEVHEEPWVARTRADEAPAQRDSAGATVLDEGMVFTVEPGVYLPGWGGVRLEDDVVMRDGRAEFLTHVPRELTVV